MMRARIATISGFETRPCIARRNGLVLTRAPRGESGWTVTHARTGRRINPLSLMPLGRARIAFALAASLGDWDHINSGPPPTGILDALRAISEMADS